VTILSENQINAYRYQENVIRYHETEESRIAEPHHFGEARAVTQCGFGSVSDISGWCETWIDIRK
jgi:hypothetical protein